MVQLGDEAQEPPLTGTAKVIDNSPEPPTKLIDALTHRYLYNVMSKNQMVTEQNKNLLVETLRSVAEILIWGDQNDSTVFE